MTSRRLAFAALAALLAPLASSCGKHCVLEGSAGAQLSLDFDECVVAWQTEQYLIVEFLLTDGSEVAELTVDTVDCPIEENVEIDFGVGCWFIGRTVIDGTMFDDILSGRVILFQYGGVGDTIDGEFDLLFMNGLSLSGEFTAPLVERTAF